jgi:hypothetical protein
MGSSLGWENATRPGEVPLPGAALAPGRHQILEHRDRDRFGRLAALGRTRRSEGAADGDNDGGPGLITLSADTWCRMPMNFGARCTSPLLGIRYRGIRIWVARAFEDQVLSRAEATALGHTEFQDLTPPAARGSI